MRYFYLLLTILTANVAEAQSFDESFQNPVPIRAPWIFSIKSLPDGKILVGGDQDFYGNQEINNIVRLNNDGSLDESFSFNRDVYVLETELLTNGDIIILAQDTLGHPYDYTVLHLSENGSVISESKKFSYVTSITVYDGDNTFIYGGQNDNGYLVKLNGDLSTTTEFATFDDIVYDVVIYNDQLYAAGLFSNINGEEHNSIVRLNLDGSIDTGFSTGVGTEDGVLSLTIQDDGKILLGGGYINSFNGEESNGYLRLNPDGSVDTGFNIIDVSGPVSRFYIKNDKLYVAAPIFDGVKLTFVLLKLNNDGMVDPGFHLTELDEFGSVFFDMAFQGNDLIFNNSSQSGNKYDLSKYNDTGQFLESFKPEISRYGTFSSGDFLKGKLIVAGDFFKINNVETHGIARLDSKGVVDDNFIFTDIMEPALQIKVLDNESILVSTGKYFFKLNADAQIQQDFTFNHFKTLYQVNKFIVLDDGKIMASDGNDPPFRLNPDGTEDESFDFGEGTESSSTLFDFDVQDDNKVIFGSKFSTYNSIPVNKLVRINTDGSLDDSFDVGEGPDNVVFLVKVLKDGSILIGGWFNNFNGHEVPHGLVKISSNGEVDPEFLENQRKKDNFFLEKVKAVQLGNRIFLKGMYSLTVIKTDGTFDDEFSIPFSINNLSDIIAFENLEEEAGSGRISENEQFLYILGDFKRQEDSDPSFLLKINIGEATERITGLPYNEVINPYLVYPNPAQSRLLISSSETLKKLDIIINDQSGRMIRHNQYAGVSQNQPLEIDVADLKAGLYHIKFITEGGKVIIRKFVKADF